MFFVFNETFIDVLFFIFFTFGFLSIGNDITRTKIINKSSKRRVINNSKGLKILYQPLNKVIIVFFLFFFTKRSLCFFLSFSIFVGAVNWCFSRCFRKFVTLVDNWYFLEHVLQTL